MAIYFTSDTHFGHANIIKHCERPFADAREMDDALVANWNARVKRNDTVYHLGDFTLQGLADARRYLARLNGWIRILRYPWHHDKWTKGLSQIETTMQSASELPVEFIEPLFYLRHQNLQITLCHFPMAQWSGSHRGHWHLHGHSHGKHESWFGNKLDVGVDVHNFAPVSFAEVTKIMEKKKK